MGDIARCSVEKDKLYNEDLLYRMFGINAELLIDHAWGADNYCRHKELQAAVRVLQPINCNLKKINSTSN